MNPQDFFSFFYAKVAQGTGPQQVQFGPDGKPVFNWGGTKGRKPTRSFDSLGDMAREKSRLGLRRVDVFDMSNSMSQMPHVGPEYYGGIEEMMSKLQSNPATKGLVSSVENWSFTTSNYASFLPEFVRDGTQYGFFKPGDDKTNVLRLFNPQGAEIPSSEIESLLRKAGYNFNATDNLPKRLGPLFNVGDFFQTGFAKDNPFVMFDPVTVFGGQGKSLGTGLVAGETTEQFFKSTVDGAGIINPALVRRQADAQKQRAKDMADDIKRRLSQTTDPAERKALHRKLAEVKKIREQAFKMRRISERGGNLEGFRLTDFTVDEISKAFGVSKSRAHIMARGGIKSDLIVPKNWSASLESMQRLLGAENPFDEGIGGFLPTTGATRGFGRDKLGGSASGRINHATSIVRADIQSMSAFPGLYDAKSIYINQTGLLNKELNIIKSTGSISPAYEDSLKQLVALADDAKKGAQQDPKTWKALGVSDRADLENKAARARRILASKNAGATLFEDKHLLREVLSSLEDTLKGSGKHIAEPRFIMPSAFRAHIKSSFWDDAAASGHVPVSPGTMLFRDGRFVLHNSDVFKLHRAHGGWDQDDSLAAHIRYFAGDADREAGLYSVNFRSPGGLGEISALKFDLRNSSPEILKHLSESDIHLSTFLDNIEITNDYVMINDKPQKMGVHQALGRIDNIPSKIKELEDDLDRMGSGHKDYQKIRDKIGRMQEELRFLEGEIGGVMHSVDNRAGTIFSHIGGEQLKYFQDVQKAARTGDIEGITSGFGKYWTKAGGTQFDDLDSKIFNAGMNILSGGGDADIIAQGKTATRMQQMLQQWDPSAEATEDLDEIRRLLSGVQDQGKITGEMIEDILRKGPSAGALGKYANIRAIADNTIVQMQMMESKGMLPNADKLRGIFQITEMEAIIDLLVQGKSTGLDISEVNKRTLGLVHGLAEAAANGVKLDPTLFDERMSGLRDAFDFALRDMSPDIDVDSVFLNLADPDERELAFVTGLGDTNQRIINEYRSKGNSLLDQAMPTRKEIMNHAFEAENYEDAKRLAQAIDVARTDWSDISGVLEAYSLSELDDPLTAAESDVWGSHFVRQRFQQQFGSLFEQAGDDTVMGSRAIGALGAFMQQHGETYGTVISSDDFSGVRQLVEEALVAGQTVSARPVKGSTMGADLPEGLGKKILAEEDFEVSRRTIAAGGEHIGNVGRLARGLWDNGLFKKGALFGGALLVGSLVYQSTKDIAPENLGGGFYDSNVTSSNEMAIPPMQTGSSSGGTTYKIYANGNHDPDQLAMMSGGIVGGPATSSVYSRSKYNPKANNDLINERF